MSWVTIAVALTLAAGEPASRARALRPSLLGIRPLESKFARMAARFPSAPRTKVVRDSDPAPTVLCFRSKDATSPVFLLVESAAAGGYGDVVTGLALSADPPFATPPEGEPSRASWQHLCRVAPRVTSRLAFSNGLRLGLSRDAVIRLLGEPTEASGDELTWRSDLRPPSPPVSGRNSSFEDYAEIVVELRDGKVSSVHVERSDML